MPKFGGFDNGGDDFLSDEEKKRQNAQTRGPTFDPSLRPKGAGRGGSSETSAAEANRLFAERGGATAPTPTTSRKDRAAQAAEAAKAKDAQAVREAAIERRFLHSPDGKAYTAGVEQRRQNKLMDQIKSARKEKAAEHAKANPKPEASQTTQKPQQQGGSDALRAAMEKHQVGKQNPLAAMAANTRASFAASDKLAAEKKLTDVERLKQGGPDAKIDKPDGSSLRLDTKTNEVVKTHKDGREQRMNADQHEQKQREMRQKAHAQ